MAKGKDLTGQRFGKLIAIRPTEKRAYGGNIVWECKCDCGNTCYVSAHDLKHGNVKSCGCLKPGRKSIVSDAVDEKNISH